MARRPRKRRAPRRQRRRGGSRLLKWSLTGFAIAIPLAYFAFTVAFYDPREPSEDAFQDLVPRDVDFYLRRELLSSDISTFPVPRMVERLLRDSDFKQLQATDWWQQQVWPAALAEFAEELRLRTADLPLDPLVDLLGTEVVVVGRLAPDKQGNHEPSFALLARISDKAKFAIEALDIGFLRERSIPGAEFESIFNDELPGVEYRRLGLPGESPVFFCRRNDLLVASLDEALLLKVLGGVYGDREHSLGKSRLYQGTLPPLARDPSNMFSAELVADLQDLVALWQRDNPAADGSSSAPDGSISPDGSGGPGSEPDEGAHPDALVNLLGSLFDPEVLEQAAARWEINVGDISLSTHAELAASLGAEPHGLRDTPSFNVAERLEFVSSLLPADVSAGITMNVEMRPFLRAFTSSFSDDVRTLINGLIKGLARDSPSWRIDNIDSLIGFLDRALGGEVTIVIRPIDHRVPAGSQPMPAILVMVPVRDEKLWGQLTEAVIFGFRSLGIDPDNMYKQEEGVGERIWLGLAAGMAVEEVAFISMDVKSENKAARDVVGKRRMLVLGTDDDFVREVVAVNSSRRDSLSDTPGARRWLGSRKRDGSVDVPGIFHGERANLVAWGNMSEIKSIVLEYADYVADQETYVDLGKYRWEQRTVLLRSSYPQFMAPDAEIPEDTAAEIEARLDPLVAARERQWRDVEIPAFAEEWSLQWDWLDLLRTGAVSLNYRATEADLQVRIETLLSPLR